jgi:hypothetical protein
MSFRKGDTVETVLSLGGFTTREEGTILMVKKGIAYVDNGPGNDPTPYDAESGRYTLDPGSRRIEKVS